jgi:hypothetical protein
MTNSGNWYTNERLAAVKDAAHRVKSGSSITAGHAAWAARDAQTQQEQRTLSSSTHHATNG